MSDSATSWYSRRGGAGHINNVLLLKELIVTTTNTNVHMSTLRFVFSEL